MDIHTVQERWSGRTVVCVLDVHYGMPHSWVGVAKIIDKVVAPIKPIICILALYSE